MCFSASASFTAGVLLTVIGTETLRKVHKPAQIFLAGIPIFFASQQFTEGVLWLTIGQTAYGGLEKVSTYLFLVMADVVWPLMIPLSVLMLEENATRKKILSSLLAIGVSIAIYNIYRITITDIHAQIIGRHIVYQDTTMDFLGAITISVYLIATLVPLFVSSIKRTHILGIIMVLSFIVSALFYIRCLTSVWCFFAAVMSFVVFYIVRDAHKQFHFNKIVKE